MFAFTEFAEACGNKFVCVRRSIVDTAMDAIVNVEERLAPKAEGVSEDELEALEKALIEAEDERRAADRTAEALMCDGNNLLAIRHAWAVYRAKQDEYHRLYTKHKEVKRACTLLAEEVEDDWTRLLDEKDNETWRRDDVSGKHCAFPIKDLPRAIEAPEPGTAKCK